jgi:MFS superfamily sulfate permease-like transporter
MIKFQKDISFLNKARLKDELKKIPASANLVIDGSGATFIDQDIFDIIDDYKENATIYQVNVEARKMNPLELRLINMKDDREMVGA